MQTNIIKFVLSNLKIITKSFCSPFVFLLESTRFFLSGMHYIGLHTGAVYASCKTV